MAKCAARSKNGKFLFRYFYFFDKGTQKSTKRPFYMLLNVDCVCAMCVCALMVVCERVCVCVVGVLALL